MEQQELYEKAAKKQEQRIQEMGQVIFLLEEENSLQRQLIEKLQKENSLLEKRAGEYLETMHRMLQDIHS